MVSDALANPASSVTCRDPAPEADYARDFNDLDRLDFLGMGGLEKNCRREPAEATPTTSALARRARTKNLTLRARASDIFSVALAALSLVELLPSRARLRFTRHAQDNQQPTPPTKTFTKIIPPALDAHDEIIEGRNKRPTRYPFSTRSSRAVPASSAPTPLPRFRRNGAG